MNNEDEKNSFGKNGSPTWILRHHAENSISALRFIKISSRKDVILVGDSEGQISLTILNDLRPRLFWKAHEKGILGIDIIHEKDYLILISQGRDNKLNLFKLDSSLLLFSNSTILPSRIQSELIIPKLLFSIEINSLNYCSFSIYHNSNIHDGDKFIALPHTLDAGFIDIFSLKEKKRIVKALGKVDIENKSQNNGIKRSPMCMTMHIIEINFEEIHLIAGYEDGFIRRWKYNLKSNETTLIWQQRNHFESIMASFINNKKEIFSVAADEQIIKYDFENNEKPKIIKMKNIGNASITGNSKFIISGGWDGNIRIYNSKFENHLATLRYHKETVQSLAFLEEREFNEYQEEQDEDDDEDDENLPSIFQCKNSKDILISGGKEGRICLWEIF